jgi:hypothetical protein
MLNYRYASLRAQAMSTSTPLSPQKYWRQVQQFEVVGACGDAARVPFLPGADAAFAPTDVWPRVKAVDFTSSPTGWACGRLRRCPRST